MRFNLYDKVTVISTGKRGEVTAMESTSKKYAVWIDDKPGGWFREDELFPTGVTSAFLEAANIEATPHKGYIDEALAVVRGNREGVYGRPDANFQTIAALWSTWLSMRLRHGVKLDAADVGHLMILMKSARIANSPTHRDSHVDIAGYLDCIDTIHQLAASD